MDIAFWGAVFSAAAALFGGIAAWNGIADRKERRRMRDADAAGRWSLINLRAMQTPGCWFGELRFETIGARVHLRSIRIVSPSGASFRDWERKRNLDVNAREIDDGLVVAGVQRREMLAIERDMSPDAVIGFGKPQVSDFASQRLVFDIPSRPWWSRKSRTRLRISLDVEERSANRERQTIEITSQEIAWTASKKAIAA